MKSSTSLHPNHSKFIPYKQIFIYLFTLLLHHNEARLSCPSAAFTPNFNTHTTSTGTHTSNPRSRRCFHALNQASCNPPLSLNVGKNSNQEGIGENGSPQEASSPVVAKVDVLDALRDKFDYEGRLEQQDSDHRCGFVTLIGAANMGKSTLLNALLQETLVTATHRPQTTRHAILGVLSSVDPPCQLCFTDTPGVIGQPAYKLQEGMMEAVKGSFKDSDAILIVTDLFSTPIPDDVLFQKITKCDKKKIVVINKIDLVDRINVKKSEDGSTAQKQEYHNLGDKVEDTDDDDQQQVYKRTISVEEAVLNWRQLIPDAIAIIPMVASNGGGDVGVNTLRSLLLGGPDVPKAFRDLGRPLQGMFQAGVQVIKDEDAQDIIPLGPPLYDTELLTDRSERFFASEIIRATLFCKLGKELPYCCEVVIESFKEPIPTDKQPIIRIKSSICVERESQKGIVVGKGGVKIKEVGIEARKQLEEFLQEKVHLDLNVKVDKNWRSDESKLKKFGYLKK